MKYLKVLSLTFVFLFTLSSSSLLAFNNTDIESVTLVESIDTQETSEVNEEPSHIAITTTYMQLSKHSLHCSTQQQSHRSQYNIPYKPPSHASTDPNTKKQL